MEMKRSDFAKVVALAICFVGAGLAVAPQPGHAQGSDWEEVPELIDSLSGTSYQNQLELLHTLTRIKLGFPTVENDQDRDQSMLHIKQRWQQWWKSTGEPISQEKAKHAQVDQPAFGMAWEFLGSKKAPPKEIAPVWIPATWTLYVTFTGGDYLGRAKEVWILERKEDAASLTKLRGDYGLGEWRVTLKEFSGLTPQKADQVLKAICYAHRYAPAPNEDVAEDALPGLYYAHSTLRLRDGVNRVLWNTEGYDFSKTRPEYRDGDSGRTYYFLRTLFSDETQWKVIAEPSSEMLAPYRTFLAFSKPYFESSASDIILLFAQQGGIPELQAMLQWADKQKVATNPQMNWEPCSGDFGTGSKEGVINSTRYDIQETLKEITKARSRLEAAQKSDQTPASETLAAAKRQEQDLQRYVTDMLALEKKEKEEALLRYPQPLRDLIIADEHPDDSDLKHLAAAVQAIRNNSNPKLFAQIAQEMDERTRRIRGLLEHILLNDNDLLDVKPWEEKQEAIAVGACIDALPLAEDDAKDDMVVILLRVCGGGSLQFQTKDGGRSVSVRINADGYSMGMGGASNPLPLAEAQNKLRRLYQKSREAKGTARAAD